MICEKEIYEWFKGSVSAQRIDVMCSLLRLCQPLELRFVGSCLEDLARKDYFNFREYELKSNDNSGYTTLMNTATTAEELQTTLNIYVSLLHSTNTVCANSLFHVLEELYGRLQVTFSQGLSGNAHSFGSENSADLLLLFIMAAHHPAFTFSQRKKISEILMSIKQMLSSLGQTVSIHVNASPTSLFYAITQTLCTVRVSCEYILQLNILIGNQVMIENDKCIY